MAAINKAALALTQCWACLGCNRLEDESFRGDAKCQNYRKATADVLVERWYGKSEQLELGECGHTDNWRPNFNALKGR
jgi:hypothetical protein